eukprot:CAMPEP_0113948262 /NCGR_PEP_ID=MMETSP1339-20121228/69483_1 /TAXON_ID=94617 /ORGANISM="Fibrocapsa japonica" /LENGTH=90 /DNA_ID=CAMNT_0000955263 /DNA_START=274 /DNA_END=543 /DNA_ORIENTATION=+ /assembly_acc=CAM_ASM_000762
MTIPQAIPPLPTVRASIRIRLLATAVGHEVFKLPCVHRLVVPVHSPKHHLVLDEGALKPPQQPVPPEAQQPVAMAFAVEQRSNILLAALW